ncbi:uncharacterized protein [Nothobranchius furzeri]|uniref:Uncharacterized protein n=1 Tax=Nothobranchius furzeri TaxID=105023 RepID=A0A1A8AIM1_NOTFU
MYKRKGKIKISQMMDEYKDQQFSDEKNSTFDCGIEERLRVIVEQELQVDDEDRRLSAHSTSETENQTLTAAIQDSDGDLEDDCDIHDGELQPTSLSNKLVKRRKAQKRHADNDGDRGLLNLSVEEKHGKGQNSITTLNEDSDGDEYGEKPFGISSTSPVQRKKMKTKHGVAAADPAQCGHLQIKGKTPWNEQEKLAVKQHLAVFAEGARKKDCILCIEKSSPVLQKRTWKEHGLCVK